MGAESKESCLAHYSLANKKIINAKSGLDRFYYANGLKDVWTAFEAFLSYKGHKGNVSMKIRDFSTDPSNIKLFSSWNRTSLFKESVGILQKESPVTNMENKKVIPLANPNDLKEILTFAYVPRGNLIHGEKDLLMDNKQGQRNRDLVEHSFKGIHEILQFFMHQDKLI
jgi:hypothetical protein